MDTKTFTFDGDTTADSSFGTLIPFIAEAPEGFEPTLDDSFGTLIPFLFDPEPADAASDFGTLIPF